MLMQAWHALSSPLYHILRICYTLRGVRTRRSSVLAPFGRQRLGAGIITALRLLYHLDLRLDGTARQMHAHASMACAFLAIIPYPSDMLYSPRDAHSPQWYFGSLRAPAARRRYNARSAVIIPCRAVWCPEGSLRFYNFCSFNACFSVLPDCLQIVAGF